MEEITLRPLGAGPYRLYRLTKRGWGTEELVRHLARRLAIPRSHLAYGGRKDRGGDTSQHLTIRGRRDRSTEGEGFELRSLGFLDRPMGPDAIAANHFSVVVRGLDPAGAADVSANLADLARSGIPNYFDDQRFRSLTQFGCFAAALLVRGQWQAAARLLLTSPPPGAPRREKERLARLAERWGKWDECVHLARHAHERRALERLASAAGDAAMAVAEFPRESLSMLLAAYQSHLWNQALARITAQRTDACVALPGLAGEYLFPSPPGEDRLRALGDLTIPTPARRLAAATPEGRAMILQVLADEGLTPAKLALRPLRSVYLSSTPRSALVTPAAATLAWLAGAEGPGRCFRLTFTLPPGSYATMVVRGLLLRRSPTRTGERPRGTLERG